MTVSRLKVLVAENGVVGALVVLVAVLTAINPRFLTTSNVVTIVEQVAEVGLVALPLAFLLMSGSIDLSVGAVASLSAVTFAQVAVATGSVPAGIAAALGVGLVTGVVNGLLVSYLGLNAFVVTLGAMNVWGGTALFVTGGRTVVGLPAASRELGQAGAGPFSLPVVVLVLALAVAWVVLNRTAFGKHVLATGGNARAAFLMGVDTRAVRFRLFVASGLVAAVAGVLLATKLQAAAPAIGSGMEMNALTMVLLGAVAFEGGKGRIAGIVAGLLFVGALRNGLVILGVSQFLQTVVVGLTLILAISLDTTVQRVVGRAWTSISKDATGTPPSPPGPTGTPGSPGPAGGASPRPDDLHTVKA